MLRSFILPLALLTLSSCAQKTATPDAHGSPVNQTSQTANSSSAHGLASTQQKVTCTSDKDTRFLEVKPNQRGGCDLVYTKFGSEKSIASAAAGLQYCREVSGKIASNLVKSGFVCD